MDLFELFEASSPKKKTLYVSRKVVNKDDIIEWARGQGFESMLDPDDLHVTLAYSKAKVDWNTIPEAEDEVVSEAVDTPKKEKKHPRQMAKFDGGAIVLRIENPDLERRWKELCELGCSWSFPDYHPHLTITYNSENLDFDNIEPYKGEIVFGPETMKELDLDWQKGIEEYKLNESAVPFEQPADGLIDFSGDILDEARVEHAGGVRVWVNPSRHELITLTDKHDLRGVLCDREVFVWDAMQGTHLKVMYDLGVPTDCYDTRFYAYIPGSSLIASDDEFADERSNVFFDIDGIRLSIRKGAEDKFAANRNFMRIVTVREKPPMMEAFEGMPPKKFWLCFSIPKGSTSPNHVDHEVRMLEEIAKGELHGVKGISASREIMTHFFYRGACVVMDPHQVLAHNDISPIKYDDPNELLANNMALLYRLFDKNRENRWERGGVIQNLMDYFTKALGATALDHIARYYAIGQSMGYVYAAENPVVNNMDEFVALIKYLFKRACEDKPHIQDVLDKLPEDTIHQACIAAVKKAGEIYASEDEWQVNSPTFKIPAGSTMLLPVNKAAYDHYDEWKKAMKENPNDFRWSMNGIRYSLEDLDELFRIIDEYDLDRRYNIRLIDSVKWERVSASALVRRGRRKS